MTDPTDPACLAGLTATAIFPPLVTHLYNADSAAHVFDGQIYIDTSADVEGGDPFNNSNHSARDDDHALRMQRPHAVAVEGDVALHLDDGPWAARQRLGPDAAYRDGRYSLHLPATCANGIFQIDVAVGDQPQGPFKPEPQPIASDDSIELAVFEDASEHYLYVGGLWGAPLHHYRDNGYDQSHQGPADSQTHLRSVKLTELHHDADGQIVTGQSYDAQH